MSDGFQISVEDADLIAALDRLGDTALQFTVPASEVSARNIEREAEGRVARATGQTAEGITHTEDYSGEGFVVLSSNVRMPDLPAWIEFGTKRGKKGSHSAAPRPFLIISAQLESGAHERRIRDAILDAIAAEGLSE